MMKIAISIMLMMLASNANSDQINNALGIDLNQAMSLLEAAESSKAPQTKKTPKQVKPTVATKPKAKSSKAVDECKLPGKVISVMDGDTIQLLDNKKQRYKIRLSGIDAPEKGQPYSKAATKYLKSLIAGKNVCVEWHKKDRYQRLVGVIYYQKQDINYQMVLKGFAWHFKKYQKEQKPANQVSYATAQTNSRLSVIGLWQEPDPIQPGDWRNGKRPEKKKPRKRIVQKKAASPAQITQATTSNFSCSGKRFCKHMNSCAEACFYLNQCGLGRLDRDKDGIPCESFCGGC